jgi:hypothetical protein
LRLRIPEQLAIATHANKGLELFAGAQVVRFEFDPNEVASAILNTIDELLQPGATVTDVRVVCPNVVMPPGIGQLDETETVSRTTRRRSASAAVADQ